MLKLLSKDPFIIPGNPHMLCLGKVGKSLREFWVLLCVAGPHKGKCYIEEYVATNIDFKNDIWGNFRFVADDEEAEELTRFAERHKLTDIAARSNELVERGMGQIIFRS
jgi:hypothetical protein